jgi:hypothetical protein
MKMIRQKYESLDICLNERSRRVWAATEVKALGRGGLLIVCKATGLSKNTIYAGLKEIEDQDRLIGSRIRKKGGGRKNLSFKDPELLNDLDRLIEPTSQGDPESSLRWTSKSIKNLANELKAKHHSVCPTTVLNLLKKLDYSLQANKKTKAGSSHPDRDLQFCHINERIADFQKRDQPTISVDTKKKENIGEYKNNGQELCKKGKPIEVNDHDFPDERLGKVAPYGVYDIGKNKGWVSVGISGDTAEFAVNTIKAWWYKMGRLSYKNAAELLVTADCGGSNGYRVRLWKTELQKFSNTTGLTVHVCHFPPGTSKWNKIEHKMFSYISKNWRGKPLITMETVVQLIGHTRTEKGLEIRSMLDLNEYKIGKKVSQEEMDTLSLAGGKFHPEWNYTIRPQFAIEITCAGQTKN